MFKFFASLRHMLAREFAEVVLGAVAQDVLKRDYLPQIRTAIKNAKNDKEKERLSLMLDEWTAYSDPNREGKVWNITAAAIVHKLIRAHNRDPKDVEELSQQIANDFYQLPRMKRTSFDKIDPTRKHPIPDALKVWQRLVGLHGRWLLREWSKDESRLQRPDSGDDALDPLANLPAAVERTKTDEQLDRAKYRELESDFLRFMKHAIKNDTAKMLFDIWHKVAKRKGPDNVVMKKDVYPVMWDKGIEAKESYLSEMWRYITKLIVGFWETPKEKGGAGVRMTDALKRRLRVTSVRDRLTAMSEVVGEDHWRQAVCAWMLSAVPRCFRRTDAIL